MASSCAGSGPTPTTCCRCGTSALYPLALVAGFLDRRTRWYTSMSAVLATGWVLGLRQGAYLHDYSACNCLSPASSVSPRSATGLAEVDPRALRQPRAALGGRCRSGARRLNSGAKAFGPYVPRIIRPARRRAGRLASAYRRAKPRAGPGIWVPKKTASTRLRILLRTRRFGTCRRQGDVVDSTVLGHRLRRPRPRASVAAGRGGRTRAIASTGVYAVFDVATLRQLGTRPGPRRLTDSEARNSSS